MFVCLLLQTLQNEECCFLLKLTLDKAEYMQNFGNNTERKFIICNEKAELLSRRKKFKLKGMCKTHLLLDLFQ